MLSFFLGLYSAIAIVIGIVFVFFRMLGGKSATLPGIILETILAAAFWPITLFLALIGKI